MIYGCAFFYFPVADAQVALEELVYAYQEDKTFEIEPGQRADVLTPILHLAKTLAAEAGIPMRVVRTPVTRMLRNLKNGTANFSVIVKTPSIDDCCISSQLPAHRIQLGVFRRPETAKLTSIEELNNKKLIVLHGYRYSDLGAYLEDEKNNIEKVVAPSHRSAFSLLAAKRADYLLDYDGPAVRSEGESLQVITQFDVLRELDLHIVLNRSYPNAEEVMKTFEKIVLGLQGWSNGAEQLTHPGSQSDQKPDKGVIDKRVDNEKAPSLIKE
ncbi:MAG: transporter substrate-binding domain-containing protein [Agarilytica sp.]